MTATQILDELATLGNERYRTILMRNHGVQEPCFGVKIEDLKRIQKRIKRDYQLALELYDSGNYDAMYLAGLIADDARMTQRDLHRWAKKARGGALASCTVAWVAAGSPHGMKLALQWIESREIPVAVAGWSTLASLMSITPDDGLDLNQIQSLLERVRQNIHDQPDQVRYAMNGFVIAAGCFVAPLTDVAIRVGETIGPVQANLGNNACQIPFAPDYIRKVQQRGTIGKKRKSAKC